MLIIGMRRMGTTTSRCGSTSNINYEGRILALNESRPTAKLSVRDVNPQHWLQDTTDPRTYTQHESHRKNSVMFAMFMIFRLNPGAVAT